jgi:SulP family sulfate permease
MFRLGFLAHFLSHPVISGFITASGILIAASQVKTLLGVNASGGQLWDLLPSLAGQLGNTHTLTLAIGGGNLAFLFWVRKGAKPALIRLGLAPRMAELLAKAGPVLAIAVSTALVYAADLHHEGVRIVGNIPQGLPPLSLPVLDWAVCKQLLGPAVLISIVGFAESVSVGQTLAAKRRQRIVPNQELVALGASNVASAFTGGFPVTGGFARSVVNFDAGAQTPAAGVLTALGIALASLFLTPALVYLPQATLAATIVVAVLSLVDISLVRRTWAYSRTDGAAVAVTLAGTLLLGVELGLVAGVGLSLLAYLYRTSKPHIAVVGWVPGTEHFRNVLRHEVHTTPRVLSLRIDESLYFANARTLEDCVNDAVASHPGLEHVVLQCSAVNAIDASALESLENIEHRLKEAGVVFHLSEVKGPVMDRLRNTEFLRALRGQVFFTHFQAIAQLAPEMLG